jgi:hypothetical protein
VRKLSLDELAATPDRVIALSADARQRLVLQCAALMAAIAASPVQAAATRHEELLIAKEAAPLVHMSP